MIGGIVSKLQEIVDEDVHEVYKDIADLQNSTFMSRESLLEVSVSHKKSKVSEEVTEEGSVTITRVKKCKVKHR